MQGAAALKMTPVDQLSAGLQVVTDPERTKIDVEAVD